MAVIGEPPACKSATVAAKSAAAMPLWSIRLTLAAGTFWTLGQKVPAARVSLIDHSGIAAADFAATVALLQAGGSPMTAIDPRFVDAFAVAGTPEDCLVRLATYGAAGVTDLGLTFVGADPLADIAALGRAAAAV